jgi:hypothetical protein
MAAPNPDPSPLVGAISQVTNKLQLIAFVVAAIATLGTAFVRLKSGRFGKALAQLPNVPENQRADIVKAVVGEPVPPNMTAEEFLRHKRLPYQFWSRILVVTLIALIALAAVTGHGNINFCGLNLSGNISTNSAGQPPVPPQVGTDAR